MKAPSLRVSVSPSISASGIAWTVAVDGESQAIHTGQGAKERAVESALRLAEDLRTQGAVLVVIDPAGSEAKSARVVRSRLAS